VIHSATKYLTAISDMVGGIIVVGENRNSPIKCVLLQNSVGANRRGIPTGFLVMRSLKTLPVAHGAPCAIRARDRTWLKNSRT